MGHRVAAGVVAQHQLFKMFYGVLAGVRGASPFDRVVGTVDIL